MLSDTEPLVNSDMSNFRLVLGIRIREERLRLGLSQEQFGALGGVGKVAQLNYEKGNRVPDAEYIEKVARHGVSVERLFGRAQKAPGRLDHLVDVDLLASAINAVGAVAKTRGHELSQEEWALASGALYELLRDERSSIAGQSVEQAATIMLAGWSASRKGRL